MIFIEIYGGIVLIVEKFLQHRYLIFMANIQLDVRFAILEKIEDIHHMSMRL